MLVRLFSVALSLLILLSVPANANIHTINGVSHGGNWICRDANDCDIHSHTSHSTVSFKVADLWDPNNQGFFYDCTCSHAHHIKRSIFPPNACNWETGNSSSSPYLGYHSMSTC